MQNHFTDALLTWFNQHGRKGLPWQQNINPYRVWVSEIMLQQTQVTTVIPYYQRFMQRFPDLTYLANAEEDEVLHLWTGLGYYSRARNLHKAAKLILQNYPGKFPDNLDSLVELPGIGRSTAGAILAIAFNQAVPILDGNVKRVLSRYCDIEGWSGNKHIETQLWKIATQFTPNKKTADYTQAIMDLGATVCVRSRPLCTACPVQTACLAYQKNKMHLLPSPKPKKSLLTKATFFLMLRNQDGEILLEKRPPAGIWGGLWSFPELPSGDIRNWCEQQGLHLLNENKWTAFRHTFSHYHLDITPLYLDVKPYANFINDSASKLWFHPQQQKEIGMPAPVKTLLAKLTKANSTIEKNTKTLIPK